MRIRIAFWSMTHTFLLFLFMVSIRSFYRIECAVEFAFALSLFVCCSRKRELPTKWKSIFLLKKVERAQTDYNFKHLFHKLNGIFGIATTTNETNWHEKNKCKQSVIMCLWFIVLDFRNIWRKAIPYCYLKINIYPIEPIVHRDKVS